MACILLAVSAFALSMLFCALSSVAFACLPTAVWVSSAGLSLQALKTPALKKHANITSFFIIGFFITFVILLLTQVIYNSYLKLGYLKSSQALIGKWSDSADHG